jgi:hypothetical protein
VLIFCDDPVVASYFDHGQVSAADALVLVATLEHLSDLIAFCKRGGFKLPA